MNGSAEDIKREGAMNDSIAEGARNEGYQPQDWHAQEQRAAAEENVQNLKELPMSSTNAEEIIAELDPADVLRKVENTVGFSSVFIINTDASK